MPAKFFVCPDQERIEIKACLLKCRMTSRCATKPFLRLVGFDREYRGVTPSAAGNGPRLIYLKETIDYAIDPQTRVWAAFGTGTHGKLSINEYAKNVLVEEQLSDEKTRGIADVLEDDEENPGYYLLYDYKSWGSFKVSRALGIISEQKEETVIGIDGKPVILKSGPNKGQPKTIKKSVITQDPTKVDLFAEELQLNRYRIFFEKAGFPVSKMLLQVIPRDGGTYIAKNRGIDRELYLIPIKRLHNKDVLSFYESLATEVLEAFKTDYARLCNMRESWDRKRCVERYCEVVESCKSMSQKAGEKWGIL